VPSAALLASGLAAAFACGSIPFGYLAGRLRGIDVRQHGSGNIGATNVGRVLGKPWFFVVFLLDAAKGVAAVLLGSALAPGAPEWLRPALGLAAVLGHNYCPWLGFKGGKGIATTAGVLAAVCPFAFAWALGAWLVFFAASRIVSLGSLASAVALAISGPAHYGWGPIGFMAVLLGVVAVIRHRANIRRLLAGTEPRMGAKTQPPPSA
jgi:glycerol-3-phosphate acyltransferase PlsY